MKPWWGELISIFQLDVSTVKAEWFLKRELYHEA